MQRMQQPMGPWAGFVPNKGGQIVMLTVWDTRLAFISSHLAAHEGQKHCHQRNSNIKEILRERWPFTITHLFIRLILPSIWGVKSTRPDLLYFYNRLIRRLLCAPLCCGCHDSCTVEPALWRSASSLRPAKNTVLMFLHSHTTAGSSLALFQPCMRLGPHRGYRTSRAPAAAV